MRELVLPAVEDFERVFYFADFHCYPNGLVVNIGQMFPCVVLHNACNTTFADVEKLGKIFH